MLRGLDLPGHSLAWGKGDCQPLPGAKSILDFASKERQSTSSESSPLQIAELPRDDQVHLPLDPKFFSHLVKQQIAATGARTRMKKMS
jgi:hypothetical protein